MRSSTWLAEQLPAAMTDDPLLLQFLSIIQSMADTVLTQIDNLEHAFDPTVAPDSMVRAMTAWLGIDWIDSAQPEAFRRDAVETYGHVLRRRGTVAGLRSLLEVLCDTDVTEHGEIIVTDSGGVFREGQAPQEHSTVTVEIPRSERFRIDDLVRIVRSEVPLHVGLQMSVAGQAVWPPPEREDTAPGDQPPPEDVNIGAGVPS